MFPKPVIIIGIPTIAPAPPLTTIAPTPALIRALPPSICAEFSIRSNMKRKFGAGLGLLVDEIV